MSPLQPGDKRLLPNPFGRIVGHPLDDAELDVPEINRKAFDSCRKLIAGVRESHESATMTLLGEPGTGKTHLLGRVRKTLDHAAGDLFVFAPMATNARTVWRHLRRAVADALLRPGVSVLRPIDELVQRAESRLATLPERDLVIVLEALAKGEHARDAAAWLRGQDLPEEALAPLRLSPPGPEENQEDASRDVVAALCALLEPGVAVFCLDQWEALQSYPGDSTGIHAA